MRRSAALIAVALLAAACGSASDPPDGDAASPGSPAATGAATSTAPTSVSATDAAPDPDTGTDAPPTGGPGTGGPVTTPSPTVTALPDGPLVWVTGTIDEAVHVIDPATATVVASFDVPAPPHDVVRAFDATWVATSDGVVRLDDDGAVTASIDLDDGDPVAITAGNSEVFSISRGTGTLAQIDALTGQLLTTGRAEPEGTGIAVADGRVWVIDFFAGLLQAFDEATLAAGTTAPVGSQPLDVAAGFGALWVASSADGSVIRFVPGDLAPTSIDVGGGPAAIATDATNVWVLDQREGRLLRLDPEGLEVTGEVAVGFVATDVAVGAGAVWVVRDDPGTVLRIDPTSLAVTAEIAAGGGGPRVAVG